MNILDYLDKFQNKNETSSQAWVEIKTKMRNMRSEADRMLRKAGLRTRWKIVGFPKLEFKTDKNYCTLPNKR